MITGTLHIQMLSDWHIGSGTGRPGSIDRLVQRDVNHLPYIPAKSLTGIWRDSCELVAQGLDAGQVNGVWQQWVGWLFGEQQPEENTNRVIENVPIAARLSVRSAHFPKELQEAFQGKVMLQSMTTFIKPGVKINPYTGSVLTDHLRFEEMARSDVVLKAEYCLQLDKLMTEDQQRIAKAVLVAGASLVERLGAKRRRGAGRCKISVEGLLEEEKAIATIEKAQREPPTPPKPAPSNQNGTLALGDRAGSKWWRIALEVTTQSPVIIHKRTVGNHQETHDYIPGTYFVPTILKQLGGCLKTEKTELGNALMQGDIVITNANPAICGDRSEAVPFALFEPKVKAKTEAVTIHQRIGEGINIDIVDGQQLKSIRRGYVCLKTETIHRTTVNSEIAIHNTVVDAKQRPDAEVGGIYTYAAIPAQSTFQLEIRIRDYLVPKNAVDPLANFLTTEISVQIGRTKKDDYGKVNLKQIKSETITGDAKTSTKTLIVWLLSDLLLRDDRLRSTTDPQIFGKHLAEELGVTLILLQEQKNDLPQIDCLVAFARSSRTESWQTKWGLPRPSLVGLSAGTILQFSVEGKIDLEKLQNLEISGFGERTAEGYGQLRFNPVLLTQNNMHLVQDQKKGNISTSEKFILSTKNASSYNYACLIEREAWREIIRRKAGAIAADPAKLPLHFNPSETKLTSSKLGTLRTLVDSLGSPNDATRILQVTTRMESKDKWKDPALTEVRHLLEDPEQVWQVYSIDFSDSSRYLLTQDGEAAIKQELWVEAVRILVDACIRAHKRASE
jgi:CRISPR-associated protein Csx10